MKSLDIKKNSDELEIFVNQLAKYQGKFEALGGYNKRVKPISNPNNNYSKPFTKDLLEP